MTDNALVRRAVLSARLRESGRESGANLSVAGAYVS